ncbi:hypothetical protein [Psychromicrobium lacuslunae]|nr:hypothetical protein [Psychromicrobium lacuslunae]
MRIEALIRPTETRALEAEADDYETALSAVEAQVPDGWQMIQIRRAK